jgi:hypothetical protein
VGGDRRTQARTARADDDDVVVVSLVIGHQKMWW